MIPPGLFPPSVALEGLEGDAVSDPLLPQETACTTRMVAARAREFALGRTCARRALAALGVGPVALVPDADRVPGWPPGIVGSITHGAGLAAAAVARAADLRGLGLDVEVRGAMPPGEAALVASALEQMAWARALGWPAAEAAQLVFVLKEATYKAWFPHARARLDFPEVTVEPAGPGAFRMAVRGAALAGEGRYAVASARLWAGVALGA